MKWITAAKPEDGAGQGTQLFAALNTALTNTPPDRIAGVIMITDGQVHDVPKSTAQLGFDAPVHALLTGTPDEFDRRIETAENAALRHRRPVARASSSPCARCGRKAGSSAPVTLKIRREGRPDEIRRADIDKPVKPSRCRSRTPAPTSWRSSSRPRRAS